MKSNSFWGKILKKMSNIKKYQTYIDKTSWLEGEWTTEPDRISWIDLDTGYHCLIRRAGSELGHLCGYVAVEPGHYYYGKNYSELGNIRKDLSYSELCNGDPLYGICHKSLLNDKSWWFGFDCAHGYYDIVPTIYSLGFSRDASCSYKNINYVIKEVQYLAKQLKEIK